MSGACGSTGSAKPGAGASATFFSLRDVGVALLLAATTALVAFSVVRAPLTVGQYIDDGVYLTTAKALAEGRGYRHVELPGEPYQTKYPILYPLLLSAVWRWFPDFPQNMAQVQILNAILWGLASWFAYRLIRGTWDGPWWAAVLAVELAFFNPLTLTVIQTAMAEPLYAVLSLAALCAAGAATGCAGPSRRRAMLLAFVAGVLAASAYLTRTIGVSSIVAVLGALLLRRSWWGAAAAALPAAVGIAGWRAWCSYATGLNAALPTFSAATYDLDYSTWLVPNSAAGLWVAAHNALDVLYSLYQTLFQTSLESDVAALARGPGDGWPIYAGMLIVLLFAAVGVVATFRVSRPGGHIYLLAYLALVLIWPFSPSRFLIPILALLVALVLAGLYALVVVALGGLKRPRSPATIWSRALPGADVATAAVILGALYLSYRPAFGLLVPDAQHYQILGAVAQAREDMADLIRSKTPPDAVVSSNFNGYMYLRTGRKCVMGGPSLPPLPYAYPPERRLSQLTRLPAPSEANPFAESYLRAHLARYYDAFGVTHIVPMPERGPYGAVFSELRQATDRRLRLVTSRDSYSLYEWLPATAPRSTP